MSLRTIRLAAVLMPAALAMHEVAYALANRSFATTHGYLETLLPLAASVGASIAIASLLPSLLTRRRQSPALIAPLAVAGGLVAIYLAQELVEAFVLGGGVSALLISAAVAWLVPPLALLLGALIAGFMLSLERVDELTSRWRPPSSRRPRRRPAAATGSPPAARSRPLACAGLRFGLARRPPPLPA